VRTRIRIGTTNGSHADLRGELSGLLIAPSE
jgi:hypothetical protein